MGGGTVLVTQLEENTRAQHRNLLVKQDKKLKTDKPSALICPAESHQAEWSPSLDRQGRPGHHGDVASHG